MSNPIAYAIPAFFLGIGLELWIARRRGEHVYRFADAITNLACGIGNQVTRIGLGLIVLFAFDWTYDHLGFVRFAEGSAWPYVIGIIGVDFAYYWWHRLSHEVNVLWAAHVVHHQSEDYNLAVALRQAWFTGLTAMPFYLPLALLGVHVVAFAVAVSVNLLYQFWIHTELVGKLGRIEGWLNTPSAHRVHHAVNRRYLDRNYGGILIVFDRWFGTYVPETERCVYGITKPFGSWNPVWANFQYFQEIANVARRAKGLDKLRVWFARPGWNPETRQVEFAAEPDPEQFRKFEGPALSPTLRRYVLVNFALLSIAITALLMVENILPAPQLAAAGTVIVLATLAWSGLFERRRWAVPLEVGRIVASIAVLAWIAITWLPS